MPLIDTVKQMYRENYRLITTDRMLQKFMVGVFLLLFSIIIYCEFFGNFQNAEYYYQIAGNMLDGEFSYGALGTDLPPLTLLLLIPPRIFSWSAGIYAILFSIYGFAFYMLGGHFMLKSCRETGFSERDAYFLLFLFFVCSLTTMTLSTGPIAPAFVIISLWFLHRKQYLISFPALDLAIMSGFYPVIILLVFIGLIAVHGQIGKIIPGITICAVICAVLFVFPTWSGSMPYFKMPDYATSTAYLGSLYTWFNIDMHSNTLVLCSFFLSAVFVICTVMRLKTKEFGMYEAALVSEIALVILLLLCPVYSLMFPVWLMMLFPMSQMTSNKFSEQKVTYGILATFCVMTLICDIILDQNGFVFELSSFLRTITLIAFGVQLGRELRTIV